MRHFYQIRHKAIYMPGTALLKFTIISARLYYLKTGTKPHIRPPVPYTNLPENGRTIPVKGKNSAFFQLQIRHFPGHTVSLS